MNIQTPPTLLQLAGQSLLRDQASAITALEYLPAALFPPLFIQAYRRRIWEPLKAMVQAWPFTVLRLGCLSKPAPDEVLKAVLDGLDVLFAQEVRPRRWKLRVLDLRKTGDNFWRMWCGDSTQNCSLTGPVAVHSSSPNMEHPLAPLEVFLDLNFNERDGDAFLMYILQWAQQRERLVHLCCKTLKISEVPFPRVRKVLDRVQLDCIQEVEVNCTWDLPTLGTFALYLGQMSNLQRLSLSYIHMLTEEEWEEEEEEEEDQKWEDQEWEEEEDWDSKQQEEQRSFSQFLSQMRRLRHLRDLNMDSPSFLRGRLDQMLRCLQTPLDKLSITHCQRLTHSDLTHLFQCPNLRQLKSLDLFGLRLADFSLEPLRALLEAVAPTLQDLSLDNCAMVDSQVEAILPVLSCCHQLRDFTISDNPLSMATIKKLFCHTAVLPSLESILYPIPLECYRTQGTVDMERLALFWDDLVAMLKELEHPNTICPGTKYCH
ncbi:PRAME family member 9/15 [Myotis brandtii]|uniref:PRAME family member 9/15 n=1 Tax=Myotis brandtii TaxID=109478 RepID=S7PTC5_MYOBR|nr:PREDICTED: PRAME family member 9/15 [Myotis brandtii]EPQ14183.1 PRAME family member 9/15 [Myotis brandtii]